MFKLAVFDLDGTLINTLDDLADSVNYALSANGFKTHELPAYRNFLGYGPFELVKKAAGEHNPLSVLDKVQADFLKYYAENSENKTRPYDGMTETLTALKENGVILAVFSNKLHPATVRLTEYFFPGLFTVAFGFREGVPAKPNPAGMHEILKLTGTDKSSCIYFGDSDVDVITGKSAGVFTVGVAWGFRGEDELRETGADKIIHNPREIFNLVVDKK